MIGAQLVAPLPCPEKYSSAGVIRPSWFRLNVWPASWEMASAIPTMPELKTQHGMVELKMPPAWSKLVR